MRKFIDERMAKFTCEGLGRGERCKVSIRQKDCAFCLKKIRKFAFQPLINLMVSRGQPRGGDVQAVFFQAGDSGCGHLRTARQAEIIAARKIKQFAPSIENFIAANECQGFSLVHEASIICPSETARVKIRASTI